MADIPTIGILGGSFNPVHIGHLMLAQYIVEWGYVDKVWLTLSPQNPLKDNCDLIADMKRLSMLTKATKDLKDIEVCDIELSLPRPSYTINTLDILAKRHSSKKFKLIIGSDNWQMFDKWKDGDRILEQYGVIVYPRLGYESNINETRGMTTVNAPIIDISSTFIRNAVFKGRDISTYLPQGVYKFIVDNKLYLPKDPNAK